MNKKIIKIFFLTLAIISLTAVPLNENLAFGYGSTLGATTTQNTPIDLTSGIATVTGGTSYSGGSLTNVNVSTLGVTQSVTLASSTPGSAITIASTSIANASIVIPDNTTILAPSGWDGFINPPAAGTNAGSAPGGFSVGNTVIEVGSSTAVLFFDQPIDIVLTGVTGSVGYRPTGSSGWIQITNICGGTFANPTAPAFPGECFITNGTDTKIHTFHLTSFASLLANSTSISSSSSVGVGGGGDGLARPPAAPVCNDQKPGSAPRLISAVAAGSNKVTIHWSEAKDPATYYLITFGNKPGQQLYGNPNVGGKGTTSYTVSSLSSNQTYYFKVRAGNGCQPGDFSNEIGVKPAGAVLTTIPSGFAQGVLGVKIATPAASPAISPDPADESVSEILPTPTPQGGNGGFFSRVLGFLKRLFGLGG